MTWSSITCGLRPIHSVKTMTWFSDKSGIASIGFCLMLKMPQANKQAAIIRTMNRFRNDNEIRKATMIINQFDIFGFQKNAVQIGGGMTTTSRNPGGLPGITRREKSNTEITIEDKNRNCS